MNWLADWWEWADGSDRLRATLVVLTSLFGLVATVLMMHIWILMVVRNRKHRQRLAIRQRLEDGLAAWLSADIPDQQFAERCRQETAGNPLARRILVDVFYDTARLLTLEARADLKRLMQHLELDRWCLKQLYSGSWPRQAYMTRVLSQFQMEEALPRLRAMIRTRNTTLRIEVITALVLFNDFSSVYSVADTDARLSDWEQLLLLERFRALDPETVPDFSRWIASSQPDWVLFGVRMCRHYHRYDQLEKMADLLNHPDKRVQLAVLETFLFLGVPYDTAGLMHYVQTAHGECLSLALRLLGISGEPQAIALLTNFAANADTDMRLVALQALKEGGYNRQDLHDLTDDPRYVDHLFDRLIQ